MRYKKIPNSLFSKNRQKVNMGIAPTSMLILHSNDQMPRNGDLYYPFRQSSDFFYLTGIEQEKSVYVAFPDFEESDLREILFILKPDKHTEIWEGKKLTKEEASEISGIQNVKYLDEYEAVVKHLAIHAMNVYLNRNENERFSSPIHTRDERLGEAFKRDNPLHNYLRLAPILQRVRVIKEPEEIELMRNACSITRDAFIEVLKTTKSGMFEYEVEALLTYNFLKKGANGHAYEPIVASGINSCFLHYNKNNRQFKDGELLFMDFGAEYANYSSDCSRVIPVGGRFSKRQRQVYDAVLRVFNYAKSLLMPGIVLSEYQRLVSKMMETELVGLGLLTKEQIAKQNPFNPAYRKYFMHGTSHFMGLDTHDVGSKDFELKPGMVFSCEPGIYIPEEEIGIRLENDIVIDKNGPIDLMVDIPIEADEIEQFMNEH